MFAELKPRGAVVLGKHRGDCSLLSSLAPSLFSYKSNNREMKQCWCQRAMRIDKKEQNTPKRKPNQKP